MRVVKQWARTQHWNHIKDVSRGNSEGSRSWDMEAVDQVGRKRYIEVKGTTGGLGDVEVTRGEVDAARRHGLDHSLVVVHQINLVTVQSKFTATGGIPTAYNPWLPEDEELDATRYRWRRR